MKKCNLILWCVTLVMGSGDHAFSNLVERPNIVFILVDDLGYSDVGYMKHKAGLRTPNIDRLAEKGKIFTQAYAAAPVCSPTRASILTGKSPASLQLTCHIPGLPMEGYLERQHKGKSLREAYFLDHLSLAEVTLSEVLQEHGYTTGFFGKWHLAGSGSARSNSEGVIQARFHPEHQGFDVNIGGCAYGQPKSWFAPYHNATIPEKEEEQYLTDRLGDEAVNFIAQNEEKPFLLYFSTYTVHTPLKAPQEVVDKNNGNTYFAMIEKLDQNVGKVMDQLERSGLLANTIVVFYSDNGGLWGNPPLRGKKGSLHEGGIRVPLVISCPDKIEAGKNDTPVTSIDLFPTVLDMLGIADEPAYEFEGVSLKPLLMGQGALDERPLYWHFPHFRSEGLAMGAAIREGDWKLIWEFETDSTYLYNLQEDLEEVNNLMVKHPDRGSEMLAKLKRWQVEVKAEMPRQ
ncbi:sulfatase [Catalinimonas alkaloidigena]|uniref:sulfatase n=1 Tax=Catalinimonas alkaloidigena TaxID=1075417 RepID=UPI0024054AD6|nr:sulfatase [Catalinimonas alkaloidigena]